MIEQQLSRKTTGGCSYGQSATDLISFYGVTPIAQATLTTAGTDIATLILEVTDIRAKLVALGLVA
jgi:hypothetical protein